MPENAAKLPKPHYTGHRNRLRQRFLSNGVDALQPYELLELILFMAVARRDVKPMAKDLIARFGSLAGVLRAGESALAQAGLTEASIAAIKVIEAASIELVKQDVHKKPVLGSWTRLLDYIQAAMGHQPVEQFRLLFLNKKNELIADEVQHTGTIDHTPAYPREIMKRALELSATANIMVHNHPSGDPTPSQADIDLTRTVITAGTPFHIVVHDHLIVSRKGIASLRQLGLI